MNPTADPSLVTELARRRRFEALWAEHHARVLGYVLRRAEGAEDAADVVAETFLVAWRRLDAAPAHDTHLWLFGVARRLLANHRRGERRRTALAQRLREEWARQPPVTPRHGRLEEFAEVFRTLPDADREVLALEAWEQLDAAQIATVLGCSRNAARIRLHRARRRLRAAMARSPDGAAAHARPELTAPTGELA